MFRLLTLADRLVFMVGMLFVVFSLTCIESDEEQPMVFVTGETWIYVISNVLD